MKLNIFFYKISLFATLFFSTLVMGQEVKSYSIQEGAKPWFDRPNYLISGLPSYLLSDELMPQQSCGERSIVFSSQFSSIILGVSEKDLDLFQQHYPKSKNTGDTFQVVATNSKQTYLYRVFSMENPPIRIKDDFNAGLILLKIGYAKKGNETSGTPASKLASQLINNLFKVQNGAAPWYDRAYLIFDNLPKYLQGNEYLPQQNCSSRGMIIHDMPKSIIVGVYEKDTALFKKTFSTTYSLNISFSINNSNSGATYSYFVFQFPNPPTNIHADFQAGLVLLKINSKTKVNARNQSDSVNTAITRRITTSEFELVEKSKFKLYLLMGQSNMVGRDTSSLTSQNTDVRIGFLNSNTGRWQLAIEPIHVGGTGIGPGIPFAQNMLKLNPKTKIGLIPTAVGGTPLSRWVKGGDLYENAVKMAKIAMFDGNLEGVLWHQGETDSKLKTDALSYKARLIQMFIDLRHDLSLPNLPIVVGQLGNFVKANNVEMIKDAIASMPRALPNIALADSKNLVDKGDSLHFDTKSQQILGARYAAAMQSLSLNAK